MKRYIARYGYGIIVRHQKEVNMTCIAACMTEWLQSVPVHIVRLDRKPATVGHFHFYGWQGSLPGQHTRQLPVVDAGPRSDTRMLTETVLGNR